MKLAGFTRQDINDLSDNEEFLKSIEPVRFTKCLKSPTKVNEYDTFTALGECFGLVYQNGEDVVVEKLRQTYLAERKDRLFLLYPKASYSGNEIGDSSQEEDKFTEFHWGKSPDSILVLQYFPPQEKNIIAVVTGIMYRTEKNGDGKKVIYVHGFDRPFPYLGKEHGKYYLVGGGYTVEEKGIVH